MGASNLFRLCKILFLVIPMSLVFLVILLIERALRWAFFKITGEKLVLDVQKVGRKGRGCTSPIKDGPGA